MPMKNPPHPGLVILQDCLEERNLSTAEAADILQIDESDLIRLCYAYEPLTVDQAVRIEMAFGKSADSLLRLQASYDLASARQIQHGISRIDGPSIRHRSLDALRRLRSFVTAWPSRLGLTKQVWAYKHGEIGDPGTDAGQRSGSVSWIRRAFWFDKYVYFVAVHSWADGSHPTYYIARAPKSVEFLSHEESISLPDGASGLEAGGAEYRLQYQQPEEALTKFGYWLSTPWTDWLYKHDEPQFPEGMPLPDEVMTFSSEEAAYEHMSRVSGREIPPQMLHLAWFTIGLSTFLWQVTSWGPTIYKFFASLHWHHF